MEYSLSLFLVWTCNVISIALSIVSIQTGVRTIQTARRVKQEVGGCTNILKREGRKIVFSIGGTVAHVAMLTHWAIIQGWNIFGWMPHVGWSIAHIGMIITTIFFHKAVESTLLEHGLSDGGRSTANRRADAA